MTRFTYILMAYTATYQKAIKRVYTSGLFTGTHATFLIQRSSGLNAGSLPRVYKTPRRRSPTTQTHSSHFPSDLRTVWARILRCKKCACSCVISCRSWMLDSLMAGILMNGRGIWRISWSRNWDTCQSLWSEGIDKVSTGSIKEI